MKKILWLIRKAIALFMLGMAISGISLATEKETGAVYILALSIVFAVLGVLLWKGKRKTAAKKKKQPRCVAAKEQAAQPVAPAYSFVSFNLSGVTFPNDEGISRQDLIRRIDEAQPPFDNSGALDVDLKPIKFKGADAIECRVNGCQIGFVPKAMVPDVLAAMKKPGATISGFQVVGGEDGLTYGVSMAVRFEK